MRLYPLCRDIFQMYVFFVYVVIQMIVYFYGCGYYKVNINKRVCVFFRGMS